MTNDDDFEELDLDGALDAWEAEFEDSAQAKSAPLPQSVPPGAPKPPPPSTGSKRRLYKPDPELERRAAEQRAKKRRSARPTPVQPLEPPKKLSPEELRKRFPSFADDLVDSEASTQIASVPDDLMETLARLSGESAAPTSPPPEGGVDLDLDELLSEVDTVFSEGEGEGEPAEAEAVAEKDAEAEAEKAIQELHASEAPLSPFEDDAAIDDLLFGDDAEEELRTDAPLPAPVVPPPVAPAIAPPPPVTPAIAPPPPVASPSAYKPKAPSAYKPKPPPGFAPDLDEEEDEDEATMLYDPSKSAPSKSAPSKSAPSKSAPPPLPSADEPITVGDEEALLTPSEDSEPAIVLPEPSDEPALPIADEPLIAAPAVAAADDEPALPFEDDDEPALTFEEDDDEPALTFEEDDDEPALSIEEDDDEPALTFDEDDDEPALTFDEDDDEPALTIEEDDDEPALSIEEDDDEPALSYEEDDDEPALTFEEDDEPEFSIEEGEDEGDAPDLGLGGDDDLADVLPPATGKTRAVTDEVAGDGGAATARRTVGRRKPRRENYAFVGSDVETLRQRVRLLRALGEGSSGTAAARSFLAAAEILERLGEVDEARTLFQLAHEADPKELIALRSLRRDAIARAEWDRAAEMLEAEAALDLSPSDRAHALSLLAEIQLHQLSDPAAAENAARGSMSARGSAGAGLLLLEACRTQNREAETFVALQDTASAWNDDRASAALLERAGRFAERAGKVERAREAFAAAAARHPSFSATLGAARTATSTRSTALTKIATTIQSPAIHEAFQRLAARFGSDEDALSLLEGAVRPTSLRLRAEASRRTEKAEVREQTLEALAAATGTTERALALIDLAEVRTARGALDEADEALRDAALADPGLDTVHVVREVLARRAGDKSRLARAVDAEVGSGGALQAAAKVVRGGDIAVERQWFGEAVTRGETPIAADILGLDAAAEAGDDEAVADALRRQADRATPDKRLGPLVELAAMRPEDRVELWREAIAEARPLVGLRALGRELSSDQPAEAAALLLEEADAMGRGNFQALVTAGRLLALAGDAEGARAAFERAMDDLPGASPASWALTDHLQRTGNIDALVAAFDRVLDQAKTPLEGANAAFRAAMISLDPESAGGFLRRARELLDGVDLLDPVLDSLLASASGVDASARASLLEARAKALPDQARTFRLRAAAAHEQAGDHPTAASIYRDALAATPDAMVEVSLDRAELAAGEHARVSSRRFDAVKDASTPEEKLVAMEALASLDLHERDETSSGILTLQSILTDAPGHLPTLRMLERLYMEGSRDDDLIGIERALLEHLPHADDVVAPTRLAIRLMLKRGETPGDAADPVVLITGRHFKDGGPAGDHWLARRVYAAALAQGDEALQLDTLRAIARELAVAPDEEASISAAIAELTAERDGPAAGAEVLRRHVDAHPDHPTLVEIYATLLRDAEAHEEAAAAFEQAAGNATVDPHRVELYYAAGRERERIEQIDAALANYEAASELDVTFADLFDRTQRLLETGGHTPRLAALVERRLQAGGDGPSMVGLHEVHARLAESMGDGAGARKALREALAIEPQRVTTLKKLAELSLKDEDWRGAAEALIRIARLRQDRDELRWVFFTLGDIYDRHMPDPKRAEAAFRRVLKLVPDDLEALDRLAQLFEREEMHDRAIDTLQQLAEREIDPDERKRHRLRLARVHELRGDPRSAEHVLEDTRRQIPTDLEVLRSIADLYQRQGAQSALSMHLNRAVADFRKVILEDPADELAWPGLVEILEWRQRRDPARVVAGAAIGVGVSDAELAARLSEGAVPAAGPAASDADLHDLLGPAALNRSVLEVFRLAGDAFDKALPFDTRQWRAEKIGRNDPARGEAQRIGQWFGAGDVQILVTSAVPRACIPVSRDPMTILVGNELLAMSTPAERAFLFASACKIASVNLSVAVRSQPADMYLLLAGLLRAYDPNHSPTGLEARALDDMAKRVFKAIPRRTRDTIGPLAFEMGGSPGFDAAKLGAAARQLGNNAALLALGSIHSALDALTKSGGGQPSASADARVNTLRQLPDAWALLTFALSDAHFEARRRAGCDRL